MQPERHQFHPGEVTIAMVTPPYKEQKAMSLQVASFLAIFTAVSKEVFVIEPAQGETFILESTEEETVEFNAEQTSNDIFVIEPTKEYETLGLDPDATDAEVKTRYRELLKEHHPDMGGDPKNFMKIRKAYLKIMESRAEGES